ncbi:MAG: prepilin-type N-terminal cleavage/methylation domain-containing protein [Patescibacteria group bacterium]|nr:prepilin-type N-terminal cleavage/methylation domain-containing protein [Patescibacteria group bacterium]
MHRKNRLFFRNYPPLSSLKFHSGFSLVEVLISLAIFVAVIVALGTFEVSIFSNQQSTSGSFNAAQNAQIILKTMLTELRDASPAQNGAYTISTAGTSTISFFSDPDNDGQAEEITYSLLKGTLYRAVIQPSGSPATYNPASQSTSTIFVGVQNASSTPVFQYFDQNYTGTSSPLTLPINISAIRLVEITLTTNAGSTKSPQPRSYTTQISLRNLKTNL